MTPWKQIFCDRTSRVRIVRVPAYLVADLFTRGTDKTRVVKNALPKDARLERVNYPAYSPMGELQADSQVSFIFSSVEFEPVAEGCVIPVHPDIVFKVVS